MIKILSAICAIAVILLILLFFIVYFFSHREKSEFAQMEEGLESCLTYPKIRHSMNKKDWILISVLCLVYGVVAFWGLGNTNSPESFCDFADKGNYVNIELEKETIISKVSYFSGLHTGNYYMQFSSDGENYTDVGVLEQSYTFIFKWNEHIVKTEWPSAKYIRIISDSTLSLGELALYDWAGDIIPVSSLKFKEGTAPLFDEQDTVPESRTFLNSTYFDEIYHVRTAYEHMENVKPYEISHPPLGKIIIAQGINIFGLNPFGWRFMGVLFGILMLIPLYVLIKNMFGSSLVSLCGGLIFAFDFMHYTQTRIATIDTYGVFFILLMYLFMYRYISYPREYLKRSWKENLPLFFCGLSFGIGCACKWTVIYGGVGLALLWLWYRIARFKELKKIGMIKEHKKELINNILLCVLFFVVIPVIIYYVSYYFYGTAMGKSGISMFFDKDYFSEVIRNQEYMFTYHKGVVAEHPYSSTWYQWLINGRPILYYLEYFGDVTTQRFAAFNNPVLCWAGLLAFFAMVWRMFRYKDSKALFIVIGYLSQLVPWILVPRITFAYHYFPSLVFLCLAICHCFNSLRLRNLRWKTWVYGLTALSVLMFMMFYPVLSGVEISVAYSRFLGWFPSWPF